MCWFDYVINVSVHEQVKVIFGGTVEPLSFGTTKPGLKTEVC